MILGLGEQGDRVTGVCSLARACLLVMASLGVVTTSAASGWLRPV